MNKGLLWKVLSLSFFSVFSLLYSKFFYVSSIHPINDITGGLLYEIHLSLSTYGVFFEPIIFPVHVAGAFPDIRMGLLSTLAWIIITYITYLIFDKSTLKVTSILKFSLYIALIASFYLLIPLPNWTLNQSDLYITTDLHSHTLLSHDGVVSKKESRIIHKERGYNIVVISDHIGADKKIEPYYNTLDFPTMIPGREIPEYYNRAFYFTIFGMSKKIILPNKILWLGGNSKYLPKIIPNDTWTMQQLINFVHESSGVVVVVALNLNEQKVHNLAKIGVDAFEIVNFGHHSLSEKIRKTMLKMQAKYGVSLVASNDWHGWSGVLNTWTLFKKDPHEVAQGMALKDQMLNILRNHEYQRVIPVSAYPIYKMNTLEIIFSPWIALYQYVRMLTLPQILSWWVWFGVFLLLGKIWSPRIPAMSQIVLHGLMVGMAGSIFVHGWNLHSAWEASILHPPLAKQVWEYSLILSFLVLTYQSWYWWRYVKRMK